MQSTTTTTQTVSISELKRESGIPIYQTNVNPINWATNPTVTREEFGIDGGFLLKGVLTPDECQQFIRLSEQMCFGEAAITMFGGMIKDTGVRNNDRVIYQSQEEVLAPLWERMQPYLPEQLVLRGTPWNAYGLNERIRFYRYGKDQTFRPHFDGCYPRNNWDMSMLTCIIYLTDDFVGGETTFFPTYNRHVEVKPVQGMACLFQHGSSPLSPEHEGSLVHSGQKYVLRTDVMYRADRSATARAAAAKGAKGADAQRKAEQEGTKYFQYE
eukprot:TRINITY_DN4046_c0_g1_i1.p1 TRINITY_DN4046_c0_g1~~TRINITY_DN4046_c0_g1_i1.p1  ORF type:complete len:270 (+),score=39.22 TRINITY_DN4046_c0_g1_i1:754-1563(+)